MLQELTENQELVEKGNDANSSSGSEDCPSDDNFSTAVLSHLLPVRSKRKKKLPPNTQVKDQLSSIFGFGAGKKSADRIDSKLKNKPKEEKKKEPASKISEKKVVPKPDPPQEEIKKEPEPAPSIAPLKVVMVDAWTQTDKIDFARAR